MKPFAVTWDYRCPFARNAHEHLAAALAGGADWDVTFLPFSLSQVHVPEGGTPVWDDPEKAQDLLALGAGVVVRDQYPDRFLDAHIALFAARHDEGLDLRQPEVVAACSSGRRARRQGGGRGRSRCGHPGDPARPTSSRRRAGRLRRAHVHRR